MFKEETQFLKMYMKNHMFFKNVQEHNTYENVVYSGKFRPSFQYPS